MTQGKIIEAFAEAVELADALHRHMDYLGTGTNQELADAEEAQDRATIQRLRATLSECGYSRDDAG